MLDLHQQKNRRRKSRKRQPNRSIVRENARTISKLTWIECACANRNIFSSMRSMPTQKRCEKNELKQNTQLHIPFTFFKLNFFVALFFLSLVRLFIFSVWCAHKNDARHISVNSLEIPEIIALARLTISSFQTSTILVLVWTGQVSCPISCVPMVTLRTLSLRCMIVTSRIAYKSLPVSSFWKWRIIGPVDPNNLEEKELVKQLCDVWKEKSVRLEIHPYFFECIVSRYTGPIEHSCHGYFRLFAFVGVFQLTNCKIE